MILSHQQIEEIAAAVMQCGISQAERRLSIMRGCLHTETA